MSFGNWTLACAEGFTPADLTEAVSQASEDIELEFIGGLSRAQHGFVDEAKSAAWASFTLSDPKQTGLRLTFRRDSENPEPPFVTQVETAIDTERFSADSGRRAAAGALAKRIVDVACAALEMKITGFDDAAG